ncbi:MAG: hypothetical protein IPF98_20785 [Gemmatimonadetes bacterium]|nr:hypothetical protein [Gemmatimonadota bacterium]MCC6771399.1 hypothetical protein [Gemmatimonadaceae bacterium]
MSGQWLQPDHTLGDASTIGGYARAHARPAAFEGSDGLSYSVAIETDATGEAARPHAAYFLFLRWRRIGAQGVDGHLESDYLAWGDTPPAAIDALGAWTLTDVRELLERHIADLPGQTSGRRWWDVMKEEE